MGGKNHSFTHVPMTTGVLKGRWRVDLFLGKRNPALLLSSFFFWVHVGITFKRKCAVYRKEEMFFAIYIYTCFVIAKNISPPCIFLCMHIKSTLIHSCIKEALNCKQPLLKSVMFPLYTKCLVCWRFSVSSAFLT